MFTFQLNIDSPAQLEEYLAVIKRANLTAPVAFTKPETKLKADATQEKRGSYARKLAARVDEYLASKGVEARPKATAHEMNLRRAIDAERVKSGEKAIVWKLDLFAREKALLAKGYDIFDDANQFIATEDSEPTALDFENINSGEAPE